LKFIEILIGFITVFFFFSLGWTAPVEDGGPFREFKESDYKGANFNVSKVRFRHGEVVVSITQVQNRIKGAKTNDENDWRCRAWVNVANNGKELYRRYLNIEPVGAAYGLFVPRIQPSSKYFIFAKEGDYNSAIYLIGKDGKVSVIHGGSYFFTEKSKFLFSKNYEAEEGVTDVFDLTLGKLVFSGQIPNFAPYRKEGMYFYSKLELARNGNDEIENKGKIYCFDFFRSKFVEKDVNKSFFLDAQKIKTTLFINDYEHVCGCGAGPKK